MSEEKTNRPTQVPQTKIKGLFRGSHSGLYDRLLGVFQWLLDQMAVDTPQIDHRGRAKQQAVHAEAAAYWQFASTEGMLHGRDSRLHSRA